MTLKKEEMLNKQWGWFADSMRLRDVINLVTSIEIPLPDSPDSLDENDELLDGPTILPK